MATDVVTEELVRAFTQEDAYPMSFATIQRLVTPTPTAAAATAQNSDKAPSLRSISPPPGLEMRDCVIWYIGEEGRGMTNLQMQHADASVSCLLCWAFGTADTLSRSTPTRPHPAPPNPSLHPDTSSAASYRSTTPSHPPSLASSCIPSACIRLNLS